MSHHPDADRASVWLMPGGEAALQLVLGESQEPGGKVRCKVSHPDGVREWDAIGLYLRGSRRPWRAQLVFPRDFQQRPPVPETPDTYRATWYWRVPGQPRRAEVEFRWPTSPT